MVFEFKEFYPEGGLEDCTNDFDTLEDAEKCYEDGKKEGYFNYRHLFDRVEGVIIKKR